MNLIVKHISSLVNNVWSPEARAAAQAARSIAGTNVTGSKAKADSIRADEASRKSTKGGWFSNGGNAEAAKLHGQAAESHRAAAMEHEELGTFHRKKGMEAISRGDTSRAKKHADASLHHASKANEHMDASMAHDAAATSHEKQARGRSSGE